MTRNLGRLDRLIRFFVGLVLVVAPFANVPQIWGSSVLAVVVMAIGGVLIVTAFVQFCPLYRVLGISTCRL